MVQLAKGATPQSLVTRNASVDSGNVAVDDTAYVQLVSIAGAGRVTRVLVDAAAVCFIRLVLDGAAPVYYRITAAATVNYVTGPSMQAAEPGAVTDDLIATVERCFIEFNSSFVLSARRASVGATTARARVWAQGR